jgi:hypothetical protein
LIRREQGERARLQRLDACRARGPVDGGDLAEHGAGLQIRKLYGLAFQRIDDHPQLACGEKEDVRRWILILDELLTGFELLPLSRAGDTFRRRVGYARENGHLPQNAKPATLIHGSARSSIVARAGSARSPPMIAVRPAVGNCLFPSPRREVQARWQMPTPGRKPID